MSTIGLLLTLLACTSPNTSTDKASVGDSGPGDTGTGDSGDTGIGDSGDTGTADSGDTGTADSGDTGTADSGDTGAGDTGVATDGCTVRIPADALVIADDTSLGDDGVVAWVCDHATLSSSGAGGRIFLAGRGELVLTGSSSTVWAPTGSRAALLGDKNYVFAEDRANLRDDGKGNVVETCKVIQYDLTDAPTDGC